MAARRGKSQARRNGSNGLPGWAWLVIGVLVTLAVVLAVPRILKSEGGADGFFRPKPNPDAQPAATNEDGEAIAPDTATDSAKPEADKPKQTQYDFYTLLPGEGVQMSDAELAASAKAEAEAQAKAAQQPDPATTATADGSLPAPIAETPAATPATAATPAVAASASTTPAASTDDTRYLLQAGSYPDVKGADEVKAKLALVGFVAQVQPVTINGKTWNRVRLGPYATASELETAKAALAENGINAIALKEEAGR